MKTALFYDRQKITEREITDNGYLKAPAYLARTGMYQYTGKELGLEPENHLKIYDVFRSEKEVFSKASLKSFANLPVTNDHPREMLDSANTRKLAVGYSGDHITKDGDFVRSKLVVTDKKAIDDIISGKTEISLGYLADYRPSEIGEEGDFQQQKIRGNHIALVDGGRAGGECAIMDSNINIKAGVQNTMSKETNSMKEAKVDVKTDNVDLDKDSGKNMPKSKPSIREMMQDEGVTLDQKVGAMFDHFMDALESLKKPDDNDKEEEEGKKKMDSKDGEEEIKEKGSKDNEKEDEKEKKSKGMKDSREALQAQIDTLKASIPTADAVHTLAIELTEVKELAKKYAPTLTLDSALSATEIKKEVVMHRFTDESLDNKSEEYLGARFDALEHVPSSGTNYMSSQIGKATRDKAFNKRDQARAEMMKKKEDAWKNKS